MKLKDVLIREIKLELEKCRAEKHHTWKPFYLVLKSGLVLRAYIEVVPSSGDDFLTIKQATIENLNNQEIRNSRFEEYYKGKHFTRISEVSTFCLASAD